MTTSMPGAGLRWAFLSGSPRIATRADAEVSGPRAHILGVVDAMRGDGHQVDTFILGDRLRASVSAQGSRRLVTGGFARQLAVDVARLGLRWSVAWQVRRNLTRRPDVVYERYALFQQLGRRFQRAGTPWVIETNGVMSSEARNERNALALQRVARRLERRSYHQADLVVCVSEELRELLVAELAVDRGKVVVIPNAVDLGRFSPAGVSAGDAGSGDDLVIGFVGFVIERQGLDELIRAVALLRGRGVPVRATIVGDGPDRARLERLAADIGVPEAVTFVGQVSWEDVPRWIRSFSVGYSGQRGVGGMPMYHSPLKIYEYLAMARPVVASHHVDAERALIASRSGWTFAAGDLDALVDTLEQVVALPPADLAGYGSRARAHVEAHHGWQHRVRQLVDELRTRGLVHADGGAAVERNP